MKGGYHEFLRQNFIEVKFLRNEPRTHAHIFFDEAAKACADGTSGLCALFQPQNRPAAVTEERTAAPAASMEEEAGMFSRKLQLAAESAIAFEGRYAEVMQRKNELKPEELEGMLNAAKGLHTHPFFSPDSVFYLQRSPPKVMEVPPGHFTPEQVNDDKFINL